MGDIKLYKKFYKAQVTRTGATQTQVYNLMDPYSLSANTYVSGNNDLESSSYIETNLILTRVSSGIYYAALNAYQYASDVTYDLVWFTTYLVNTEAKKLSTRFRINVNKYSHEIEIEILNNRLDIEIL